jgi:hypothetical protein
MLTEPCAVAVDWHAAVTDHAADRCGEPTMAEVLVACLHEHVSRQRICSGCAAEFQLVHAGEWVCVSCAESSIPHRCVPVVELRWDSGEVTVL